MQTQQRISRRVKAGAAALLAASVLVASAAPSSARMWPPQPTLVDYENRVSAFQHHFYRGTQHRYAPDRQAPDRLAQDRLGADMMATADEAEMTDEAMSYCASRFKSYDPGTGTYLGYDGNEHACP